MTDPQHHRQAAARLFQTLAADGATAEGDQLSRTRKLFVVFVASLLFVAAPLAWAGSAAGSGGSDNGPEAVLVKSDDDDLRDEQDNSGPGGGDDDTDTDTGTSDPATGTTDEGKVTAGDDDDTGTGTGTRGKTGQAKDHKTGKETGAKKTDRVGLDTGVSTKGETDPGDKTGKSERR
jgi:hypothetical protein